MLHLVYLMLAKASHVAVKSGARCWASASQEHLLLVTFHLCGHTDHSADRHDGTLFGSARKATAVVAELGLM